MNSIIHTTEIKLADMNERILVTDEEFSNLPGIEREYLEIQRKYQMFSSLYDFLLRRMSEVEIQRAANLSDHEVIDLAGDSGVETISKSPKTTFITAIIWAILLPAVFLFVLVFFNDRVMVVEDISSNGEVPIIGEVSKSTAKALDKPNSHFAEMLRLIRIKLGLSPKDGKQVVLVTSSTFEEGKTFFASNFASIYALAGQRTILLGFDLRRPKIAEIFGVNPSIGITDYFMNQAGLDEVIQKSRNKNLDLLLSGPTPQNPDELIESQKTRELFLELRRMYDYIVIDTPPISLVADAFLLNEYADATILVVRSNFSKKKLVSKNIREAINNKMKDLSIIINDVKWRESDAEKIFYDESLGNKNMLLGILKAVRRGIIDFLRAF